MSTAREMELRFAEFSHVVDAARAQWERHFKEALQPALLACTYGRRVHAARARKLRRRGHVVHLIGRNATGRGVFYWEPSAKARRMFAAGISAMMDPPARDWFGAAA